MNFKNLLKFNWSGSFKRAGLISLMLCFCLTAVIAQQITVTGTVTDATGETLVGVNVIVKGTNTGTVTDVLGRYSLSGLSAQSVLVFSFIGFEAQEFTVGDMRTINVTMIEDSQQFEEVIVVGYGTRRAGEMTGSVSVVKAEEIQKLPAVTAGEVLRNVPGLTVTQSNTPGGDATVRVRGLGTVNNSSPLWVVDGIPGASVSPNEIETITVLKDAAAQAIYGTRAANGVILVTTKSGRKGERASVTVNMRTGFRSHVNHYKFLNTQEYGQLLWLEGLNDWVNSSTPESPKNIDNYTFSHQLYGPNYNAADFIPDYILPLRGKNGEVDESQYKWGTTAAGANLITKANKEGTDWFDAIERKALFTDLSMSVTGGSDKTTYAFSVGYVKEDGVLRYTDFDRLNLRANIRTDVNKWLTVGQSISGMFSNRRGTMTNNAEDSPISWAYRIQPILPVYDVGGNYAGSKAAAGPLGNARNPLGVLYYNRELRRESMNLMGNVYANINIIQGLQFRTLVGMTYGTFKQKNIEYYDNSHSEGGSIDVVTNDHNWSHRWNWTNTLEYRFQIGKNDITVMAGSEAIENNYYSISARRQNYVIRDPHFMDLSSGQDGQQNGSGRNSWALFSYFGRLNYVHDGKYLLEGVIRRDGSSRFAKDNRYGVFPAFSVGWVLTREQFMSGTRTWLDNLKLRGGYGLTGNDQMDNYNSYSTFLFQFSDDQGTMYPMNGGNGVQGDIGFRQNLYGISDTKWEATRTTNVGVDITLFRALSVTFDVWQRRTTDMLYPKPMAQVLGRVSQPSINVGEMENKGFDLDIGYRGSAFNRDLGYRLNLNVSRYSNKITKLPEGEFMQTTLREIAYTRSEQGTAFPEFYGYTVDGIFKSDADAANWPTFGAYNMEGHYRFVDISGPDGVPDGRITPHDRKYIGSPHPKFVTGLNFTLDYKGFDLTGQFYASIGNKMVNYVRRWLDYKQFIGGRSWESLYKTYGSPWLKGEATLPKSDSFNESQLFSTAFLEDASYLRLRNLQVGYDLNRLISIPTVSSLRVYFQVTNLFTITKYTGLDPETTPRGSGRGDQNRWGIDEGQWPTPRQVLFGISVGL